MEGSLFSKTNLEGVSLDGSQCTRSDFSRANMKGLSANNVMFDKARLRGAILSGADLSGASLRGADLTGIVFDDETNFFGAWVSADTIFPDGLNWDHTSFFLEASSPKWLQGMLPLKAAI